MGIFDSIIIILIATVAVSAVFHYLRLPGILGYIIVGIFLGPYALGFIPSTSDTIALAEFGIVFLMFSIGLEFSFNKLMKMRYIVFGFGGLQVLLSIIVTTFIAILLGMTIPAAITVGGIVTMSSTAIALKQLHDQDELTSAHGANALGILLFQDLAVIPFLILIPNLGTTLAPSFMVPLSLALAKGLVALFIIIMLGRYLLRPVFKLVSAANSVELFTLTVLLVTLSAAWFTHYLGLSLALGGFLSGIMCAETEFRHQITNEIRPFRDVFLGMFFISIGMQLAWPVVTTNWTWMLLLFAALLFFKFILITVLGLIFRNSKKVAIQTGLVLAQGSEFAFVILGLALQYKLFPLDYAQVMLGALLMSMIVAPFLIRYNSKIAGWFISDS